MKCHERRLLWGLAVAACVACGGGNDAPVADPTDDPTTGSAAGTGDTQAPDDPAGSGMASPQDMDVPGGAGNDPSDAPSAVHGEAYFAMATPWTRDVSDAPVDPASSTIIGWLNAQGFGLGHLHIDFSIPVLAATADTPMRAFDTTDAFYTPDCDHAPMPIPDGGFIEGEDGYACEGDGDCHLLVVDRAGQRLYEMYRANIDGNRFEGGCLAVWDLARSYDDRLRGDQCTSADAAGFPIAPLLFSADEVAAGEIAHAIRFILPNPRMRAGVYVRPATHAGGPSGPEQAPPYGVRLRLRADYPLEALPNEGARVVARAMQRYGMLLADGGNVALTAQSDRNTDAKWEGLLGPRDLDQIQPADFEVIEMGDTIPLTYDCVRVP